MSVDPLRQALDRRPATRALPDGRPAAVAVVFGPDDELLLIRRAERTGDPWSGHVGLPGGHVEPGEDPLRAAIRETGEEVGLALDPGWLLGQLDDFTTPALAPRKVVRPFVFRAPSLDGLRLEPSEVAATGRIPLSTLLADHGRTQFELEYGGQAWTLPCVELPVGRLWGMTLRVVDDLLDRLDGRGHGLSRLSPRR